MNRLIDIRNIENWNKFKEICQKKGTSMRREIEAFIESFIKK